MKRIKLSEELISSLTELGLLESEARIYAALVSLGYAEVKELLEILDISKPRIYDGLRAMEEKGLIIQTSPKPAIYQAIEPKIALEMILKKYDNAKTRALQRFQDQDHELIDRSPPPICYIFGDKSFELKIIDMLENAKESVYCRTSGKYLKYIEKLALKDIKLVLTIMSDSMEAQKRLERLFKKHNVQIQTLTVSQMEELVIENEQDARQHVISMTELKETIDMENLFLLIVDNAESLMIPPIKSNSLSAITSTNKAMVYMMDMKWKTSSKK